MSAEITYGVERLCMFLGGTSNIFETTYGSIEDPGGSTPVSYGKLRHREELELSHYSFNLADVSFHRSLFDFHEKEGLFLLKEHGHFISAYEQMLKMSHAFNVLDARGAVSASERPGLIKRVRDLASGCAQAYLLHHFPLQPLSLCPKISC